MEETPLMHSYPLEPGVRATIESMAWDIVRTFNALTDPTLERDDAAFVAVSQLKSLSITLRRILRADELSLLVAISASQPTTSTD